MQAQKRSADGRKTRRVGSAYHESACSTRSSGAVRRWWKGWPVEGFSVSQWPLFARQCKARGNDLVPLRRWYAPVAPQPASPSRHVDIAVRLPQREARPTLFSELARQPPYNASTHVASALSLRLIAPFSLIDGRITGVPCRLSFFFFNRDFSKYIWFMESSININFFSKEKEIKLTLFRLISLWKLCCGYTIQSLPPYFNRAILILVAILPMPSNRSTLLEGGMGKLSIPCYSHAIDKISTKRWQVRSIRYTLIASMNNNLAESQDGGTFVELCRAASIIDLQLPPSREV